MGHGRAVGAWVEIERTRDGLSFRNVLLRFIEGVWTIVLERERIADLGNRRCRVAVAVCDGRGEDDEIGRHRRRREATLDRISGIVVRDRPVLLEADLAESPDRGR